MIMKQIAILGSTGSIGTQTLEIVRENPDLRVVALAAGRNIALLREQIKEFRPEFVAVWDPDAALELSKQTDVEVLTGMDGLIAVATAEHAEMLVTAIVGMIGIRPTIAAIRAGKDIALANKETLVCAGHIIMPLAKEHGVQILPVDSEHSAIFQSLQGGGTIEKILLTASGGAFRKYTKEQLEQVTLEDALKHPNWVMGPKVTIDSSTLVNKGLEVMEASWLFGVDVDHIQVLIQPKSIVHSAVQYTDGAIIAQLGVPDMKLPIQYAIFYPDRRPMGGDRLDLAALGSIEFELPRPDFKGLPLAYRAAKEGGSMPTVFNAANELAVRRFLKGEIQYTQITDMIERAMDAHCVIRTPSVEEILAVEQEIYATL